MDRSISCGFSPRPDRERALRVEVDQQHLAAVLRERGAQVDRGRGLADAALLVAHRDDPGVAVDADRPRLRQVGHRAAGRPELDLGVGRRGREGPAGGLCLGMGLRDGLGGVGSGRRNGMGSLTRSGSPASGLGEGAGADGSTSTGFGGAHADICVGSRRGGSLCDSPGRPTRGGISEALVPLLSNTSVASPRMPPAHDPPETGGSPYAAATLWGHGVSQSPGARRGGEARRPLVDILAAPRPSPRGRAGAAPAPGGQSRARGCAVA